jgi:hypothetical protein
MRVLPVILAATFLLSSAASAAPDTALQPTAQQVAEIAGDYALSDGRRAQIVSIDNRVYVRIGRRQQKELLMVGPNRFASRSGDVTIELQPDSNSNNDRIVLNHVQDLGGEAPIRIASVTRTGRGSAD